MRAGLGLAACVVALAASAARAPPVPVVLFDPPPTQTIMLQTGQSLDLRFPAHYASGMRWNAEVQGGAVRYLSTAELVGADNAQVQQLLFVADTPGEAVLVLAYRRPWTPQQPPRETRAYRVLVK